MSRCSLALALLLPLGSCSSPAGSPANQSEPGAKAESALTSKGRGPVLHIPIPDKVREGAGRFAADWSFDLRVEEGWTAHVHVVPEGQLVPLHHHPKNEELVFVAQGEAEWSTVVRREGLPPAVSRAVATRGTLLHAPPGSAHSVRNRKAEPLATVVIHRPPFGQNWYLLPAEVESSVPTTVHMAGAQLPSPLFPAWEVNWWTAKAFSSPVPPGEEWLLLVAEGRGTLGFEEHKLSLEPGTFVSLPASLQFEVQAKEGFEAVVLRIPATEPIP